jgi:DNA-binding Lrp family transcriptional regulator
MVRAYLFIQTRVGMGPEVARNVGRIRGVLSSEGVTGPYDVIARAEASTLDNLGKLVATEVHAVEGITRTITCIGKRSSDSGTGQPLGTPK